MMSGFGRKFTTAAVALSLCAVPTATIAATPAAAPVSATQAAATPASPWLTLSAMTTSSSAASTAAAAQDYDDGPGFPPIAPLVVILATLAVAIYILAKGDNHHGFHFQPPVSPA